VHLESGGFFCFGCDVTGGDVLAFIMQRDSLDFKTAAKSLRAWSDINEEERLKLASEAAQRKQQREKAAQIKDAERTQRIELRTEIHTLVEIQAEVSDRLSRLLQGAAPAYENEVEDCWGALSLAFEDLRNCEAGYMAMIGSEYAG
jgi:biopolymer transport protein ExbB/TolQ